MYEPATGRLAAPPSAATAVPARARSASSMTRGLIAASWVLTTTEVKDTCGASSRSRSASRCSKPRVALGRSNQGEFVTPARGGANDPKNHRAWRLGARTRHRRALRDRSAASRGRELLHRDAAGLGPARRRNLHRPEPRERLGARGLCDEPVVGG